MEPRHVFIIDNHIYGDDIQAIWKSLINNFQEIKKKCTINHDIELSEYYALNNIKLCDNCKIVLKYNSHNGISRLYARYITKNNIQDVNINIIKVHVTDRLEPFNNKSYNNYDTMMNYNTSSTIQHSRTNTDAILSLTLAGKLNNIFKKPINNKSFPQSMPTTTMINMAMCIADNLIDITNAICVIVPSVSYDNMIDMEIAIMPIHHASNLAPITKNLFISKSNNIPVRYGPIIKADKTISSKSFISDIEKKIYQLLETQNGGYASSDIEISDSDFELSDSL